MCRASRKKICARANARNWNFSRYPKTKPELCIRFPQSHTPHPQFSAFCPHTDTFTSVFFFPNPQEIVDALIFYLGAKIYPHLMRKSARLKIVRVCMEFKVNDLRAWQHPAMIPLTSP